MKKTLLILGLASFAAGYAQSDKTYKDEDDRQRGYYDRPWLRYEAESGKCETNGTILPASFENKDLQSEATNQVATKLTKKGDYIQWTNEKEANALTLRFSLPDSQDGKGTQGNIGLYVDGEKVKVIQSGEERDNILLNSYWAWQYFSGNGSDRDVAYNSPRSGTLRMRFDEVIVRLKENIPANATFKLVKEDDSTNDYTIDFVELEMEKEKTFESITSENKIQYNGDGSDLQQFIYDNSGKTIYIPAGKYNVPVRLNIRPNTTLQGAGIFFTEIYFPAELNATDYAKRGLTAGNNVVIDGLYINTALNERYLNRSSSKQPGKGLNGSFGSGSKVSNVLIQHFECGAWLQGANNFTMEYARIRNNYADGTNLAGSCKNSTVRHTSYRNNGDDDMASFSNTGLAEHITYEYNTSECNWRASAIGFFGGKGHTVKNCLVIDPIEGGIRFDTSFGGKPFSETERMNISDISVYKGGTFGSGSTYNQELPTIKFTLSNKPNNISNISLKNIDLYNSKSHGIAFMGATGKKVQNICLENITIDGFEAKRNGVYVTLNLEGNVNYNNITFPNTPNEERNYSKSNLDKATNLSFCNKPCGETCDAADAIETVTEDGFAVRTERGAVSVSGATPNTPVVLWNLLGQKVAQTTADSDGEAAVYGIPAGTYILMANNARTKIIVE